MTKRAVVVGINDYSALRAERAREGDENYPDLSCCVADANSIATLLPDAFGFDPGNVTTITDGAATRAGVLAALRAMVNASEPGDVALFYYSGHGAVEPDDASDPTCERFYESVCTFRRPFLTDKDLWRVASGLQQSVVNLTVVSDSCHSGGLDQETDAAAKYRSIALGSDLLQRISSYMNTWIPAGISVPTNSDVCNGNVSNVQVTDGGHLMCDENPDQVFVDLAKMTLVSGCRFWELSYEDDQHGLLTRAILDTASASDFQITHGDLVAALQASVATNFQPLLPSVPSSYPRTQTPQLRGQRNRMGEGFLQPWSASM